MMSLAIRESYYVHFPFVDHKLTYLLLINLHKFQVAHNGLI